MDDLEPHRERSGNIQNHARRSEVLGLGLGAWVIVRERSLQKRQAAAVNTL